MLLAIDTATDIASIALALDGKVKAELTWHVGQSHTVELLPSLIYLLQQAKTELSAVKGIIVAKGPGSYNGLRVGMSLAKGLAYALDVPITGVSTLEVEAYQQAASPHFICPILDAGRGEIAVAMYQMKDQEWKQLWPVQIITSEELCQRIEGKTLFCGAIPASIIEDLKRRLGKRAIIPQGVRLLRRAGFLAELGCRRLERGESDDLVTLEPLYLRRPFITIGRRSDR